MGKPDKVIDEIISRLTFMCQDRRTNPYLNAARLDRLSAAITKLRATEVTEIASAKEYWAKDRERKKQLAEQQAAARALAERTHGDGVSAAALRP